MIANELHAHLARRIQGALPELQGSGGEIEVAQPRDLEFGDAAFACFPAAKRLKQAPTTVAAELAKRIMPDEVIEWAKPAGPFVNFRFRRERLAEVVVKGALTEAPPVGPWHSLGKTVIVDFSSPNIAKPFHLGHLRSTVIGGALRRLYQHVGYRVVGINHIGDWGAQFGKIMTAWVRWGDEDELAKNPMRHLFEIYVRYQREEKEDESMAAESAARFQRLESGEENEERRLWKKLRDISLEAFQGPYRRLGTEFEAVTGESFYESKLADAIQRVVASGCASESDGALIVDLSEHKIAPLMLRKSDGTTLYATRDLAAVFYRHETYRFDRALYVVGGEQKLYFQQLKETLRKMKLPYADSIEHVDFGLILFKNEESGKWEKGKTRTGNAIFLDEVLDEAVAKVKRVIEEKNPELADKDRVAEDVGVSAIIYNDLKSGRIKDVKFDWDEMLSFEGDTGPYVQYAGARLCGILRNAGVEADQLKGEEVEWGLLADAGNVLLALLDFGPTVWRAAEKNEPSLVTTLLTRIAGEIHSYLKDHHVLRAEPPLRQARLHLVAASRKVLVKGMELLGMRAPEEM